MPFTYKSGKDGTMVTGVPEGTDIDTSTEIDALLAQARAAGLKTIDWSALPQAPQSAPTASPTGAAPQAALPQGAGAAGALAPDIYAPQAAPQQTKGQQMLEQLPHDLGAVARGVVGGVTSPVTFFLDPLANLINLLLPENMKQLPPSQGLQQLLTMAGVPQAETEAQKILQAATSGLAGGGGSFLAGKALQAGAGALGSLQAAPSAVGAVGQAMAMAPGVQAAGGASAEVAAELARQQGAGPVVQLAAGLGGGLVGGTAAGLSGMPAKLGAVQNAKEFGIDLMTSDVFPKSDKVSRAMQLAGEAAPITGTAGMRKAQQISRVKAIEDVVRQYGAEDLTGNLNDVAQDLLAKRSSDIGKWSGAKNEVIDRLSYPAPGSAQPLIGGVKALPGKTPADLSREVPMTQTTQAIDDSITYLNQLKTDQVKPIIAVLEDWKQAIQGQDLRNIETLRKQIGEAFTAPEMASVRSTGEKVLSKIYGPVNEDMGAFIRSAGSEADFTKWKVANKELSSMMGELNLPVLKNVLEQASASPEVVQRMLFSTKRSDVQALYRNLTAEGQESARSAIVAKAAEKAGYAAKNELGKKLSPEAFVGEIDKLGKQVGVLFSGAQLKQVQGLAKAINMTRRAGEFSLNPPTGIQNAVPLGLMGIGAAGQTLMPGKIPEGMLVAGGLSAGYGLGARVYESPAVRNILMNMSTLKEGSKEAQALLASLITTIETMQRKANSGTPPAAPHRAKTQMPN